MSRRSDCLLAEAHSNAKKSAYFVNSICRTSELTLESLNNQQSQVYQRNVEPNQMKYLAAIASESEKNILFARNQLKLQVEQLQRQQDWQRHIQ